MVRRMWSAAAVAVGVTLGGSAAAEDDMVRLGRFQPQPGGFAGAVRSAADAEPVADAGDDTILVHGYRHGYWGGYYGGYRGFSIGIGIGSGYWPRYYGGYGYGFGYPRYGYGLGGFGYGYPRYGYGWPRYGYGLGGFGYGLGYSSFYRPGFSISLYSAPRFYYPSYSYGYGSYFSSGWCRIGGLAGAVRTPAAALGNAVASNGTAQLLPPPTPLGRRVPDGTFRYDGGPTAPVPMPTPDPTAPETIEPARDQPTSVPISLPARKQAYKYPAYGDNK